MHQSSSTGISKLPGVSGKVVVITGASSGLGEATARLLSANSAKVILAARRIERLRSLADELSHADAIVQTDVTDLGQVRNLIDHAVKIHGRIDVLVNNAGLMPSSMLENTHVEEWMCMVDVNIKGVLQ